MFKRTIRDRFPVIEPYVRGERRVMDLGCVDSRKARHNAAARIEYKANLLHKRIAEANPDTLGVDIDPEGAAVLNKQGYHVIVADVETMALGRQFDTIVAGEIIEHLENPGLFLRNMHRHLKPGGVVVVMQGGSGMITATLTFDAKGQMASNSPLPLEGAVFISVNDFDKGAVVKIARDLDKLGLKLLATSGTASVLEAVGLPVTAVNKVSEGSPNVVDAIRAGDVHLIINTPRGGTAHQDGARIRSVAHLFGVPINVPCSK